MRYDPEAVRPMREELVRLGAEELMTPEDVDQALAQASGTTLLVINSVCGCAAGMARPAVAIATGHDVQPDRMVTVFAGQELEATACEFEHVLSPAVEESVCTFLGHPPVCPHGKPIPPGFETTEINFSRICRANSGSSSRGSFLRSSGELILLRSTTIFSNSVSPRR